MKTLLLATGNPGKKQELLEAFEIHGRLPGWEFVGLETFPQITEDVEETGKTFEENARLKAEFFGKKAGIPTLGEDSGIVLEAFPEKFGVRTRREIDGALDEQWLDLFLKMLTNAPTRQAAFFSATAFFDPKTGQTRTFLGQTPGVITQTPEAPIEPGIPVSAVFRAAGQEKVYSALSKSEKNKISHRGKSVQQLIAFLKNEEKS